MWFWGFESAKLKLVAQRRSYTYIQNHLTVNITHVYQICSWCFFDLQPRDALDSIIRINQLVYCSESIRFGKTYSKQTVRKLSYKLTKALNSHTVTILCKFSQINHLNEKHEIYICFKIQLQGTSSRIELIASGYWQRQSIFKLFNDQHTMWKNFLNE